MAPRREVYAGHALRPVSRNKPIIDKLLSSRYQKVFFFFCCHGNQHHGVNRNL